MKSIQLSAAMFGQNRYGARFDDLDIKRQVQVLIEEFGQSHLTRDKRASYKTAKARAYVSHSVISELRSTGYTPRRRLDRTPHAWFCFFYSKRAAELAAEQQPGVQPVRADIDLLRGHGVRENPGQRHARGKRAPVATRTSASDRRAAIQVRIPA